MSHEQKGVGPFSGYENRTGAIFSVGGTLCHPECLF